MANARRRALQWGVALALLFSFGLSSLAGEAPQKSGPKQKGQDSGFAASKNEPIFISSDRMEVDHKKNTITYKGRVVALQGDMTMRSEVLTAHYDPEMKGVREVIAEGKVHVTQGDRVATGSKAVFDGKQRIITLTGDPVVRQGNSQISGSRITFFMEQDRAVVEGGKQRVKATIFPEELERKEKGEAGLQKGR